MKLNLLKLSTALALGCFSLASQAGTTTYTFGDLLAGTYTPPSSFATLSVSTTDNTTFDFTLTALDLNSLFTSGAFIGAMAVDVAGSTVLPTASLIGTGNGVSSVSVSPGGGPTGAFDFRYVYGLGSDKLTANESVSWESTYSSPVSFEGKQFALQVRGLTDQQGGSAWYVPTPVPEPSTYLMMALGLGLLGFIAKRRLEQTPSMGSFNFA